jgi:hypothetical protein
MKITITHKCTTTFPAQRQITLPRLGDSHVSIVGFYENTDISIGTIVQLVVHVIDTHILIVARKKKKEKEYII